MIQHQNLVITKELATGRFQVDDAEHRGTVVSLSSNGEELGVVG